MTRLCGRAVPAPARPHPHAVRPPAGRRDPRRAEAADRPAPGAAGRRRGEVPLETYARLQSPDAMPRAVLRRMVRGVSTRDYEEVIDLARDGFGVAKSSVSRDFVRASAADVKALAERRFEGERFPVVMIDGVEYAGETMVVALGITEDGTKRILGLRQGATENAEVCNALLEDLGHRRMPVLLKALAGLVQGEPTDTERDIE